MATLTKSTGTVTLSGAVEKVTFPAVYGWVWIKNLSDADMFVGLSESISAGADGVLSIPSGDAGRIQTDGQDSVYLLGSGNALVVAQNYADCPFKSGRKGGGADVGGESSYTLKNAVDYPLLGLTVYGKSVQDGVPSPENPVEIVSVESPTVTVCGKNLIPFPYEYSSETINGLTFVVNSDGGINVSGTCTDNTYFNLCRVYFGDVDIGANLSKPQTKNGFTFSKRLGYTPSTKTLFMRFFPNEIINETFYPQVELGDTATSYEPYHGATANITSSMPLCGIPVESGGNYTDKDGQQWVCDELVYNADGTGKVIKNIRKYTFTGTDNGGYWTYYSTNDDTKNRFAFVFSDENIKPIYDKNIFSNTAPSRIICDEYKTLTNADTFLKLNGIGISHNSSNPYLSIYDDNYSASSTHDWIAHIAENPITVVYQLKIPQEIPLTAAEITALRQVQTFNGITNISNDGGADMDITYCTNKTLSEYVMPITTGLQKQIDELKAAVLSLGGNV